MTAGNNNDGLKLPPWTTERGCYAPSAELVLHHTLAGDGVAHTVPIYEGCTIPQANQVVYVLDLSHAQKEERREWIEHHHRHLIERELFQPDQYITEVLERLLMYEIDSDEDSDESETDRQAR